MGLQRDGCDWTQHKLHTHKNAADGITSICIPDHRKRGSVLFLFFFFWTINSHHFSLFRRKVYNDTHLRMSHSRDIIFNGMEIIGWKGDLDISFFTLKVVLRSWLCCIWKRQSSVMLPLRIVIHQFILSNNTFLRSLIYLEIIIWNCHSE